jgi:hypothetical protein
VVNECQYNDRDALTSGGDWLLLTTALGMEGGCGVNMRVLF